MATTATKEKAKDAAKAVGKAAAKAVVEKARTPKEKEPNWSEEIEGGHPTPHAVSHGMTEDDLSGGKLTPEAEARLSADFEPNAEHVPPETPPAEPGPLVSAVADKLEAKGAEPEAEAEVNPDSYTKDELMAMAAVEGVEVNESMTKAEIADAINTADDDEWNENQLELPKEEAPA